MVETGTILEALGNVTALCFFVAASILGSFRTQQIVPTKKLKTVWRLQLGSSLGVFALCVARAVVVACRKWRRTTTSEDFGLIQGDVGTNGFEQERLISALLTVWTWLVLNIALDGHAVAAVAHIGAWSLYFSFDLIAFIFGRVCTRQHAKNYVPDTILQVARLGLVAGLILVSALTLCHREQQKEPKADVDETQPLLASTNESPNDDSASVKSDDSSDSDDDEKDEEEEKSLKKLRERSWWQYLSSFKVFLPFLLPRQRVQQLSLAVLLACTVILRFATVLLPLTLGQVVNVLTERQFPAREIAIYLVSLYVISPGGLPSLESYASTRLSTDMNRSMKIHCYSHIMRLSADYHNTKRTARIWQVTSQGSSVVHLFTHDFLLNILPTMVDLFVSVGIVLWLFGPYVCFVIATTVVLYVWTNAKFLKRKTKLRRKYWDQYFQQDLQMTETTREWTTVSDFSRVTYEENRFKENSQATSTALISSLITEEVADIVRQFILSGGFLAAILLVTYDIAYGVTPVGNIVMLVSYWDQALSPAQNLAHSAKGMAESLVDAEKLMLLLEKKPSINEKADAPDFRYEGGALSFDHVTFGYNADRIVTDDVSFSVKPGETVAVVGETGGGKSTLFKLLFRYHDPNEGRILIDGQDIKDLHIDSFRSCIGLVAQNPALFNMSVMENVRYGNLEATDEEVMEACKAAALHDKILTFSQGYKTKVGERGTKLSGGELQRLAIARTILKNPRILLLDEATSAMDSITESKIQDSLTKLSRNRTTLVIAHRLSTIKNADKIMVLKSGKLLEIGPHHELVKKDGPYKELWDAQLKLQAGEEDASQVQASLF